VGGYIKYNKFNMGLEDQGILGGLSPEEILSMKEREGGIVYDDPVDNQPNLQETLEMPGLMDQTISYQEEPISLGRVEPKIRRPDPEPQFSPGLDFGWKNLPLPILPSKGWFYPDGTKIAIRAADVKEIRHYSTIDEEDLIDLNEKLNFILSKCCTIHYPGEGVVSFKDLKQEDRFFLIMAIRDLTFVQGENRIIITPDTDCKDKTVCPVSNGIELRTGILSDYEIDPRIMKYYSPMDRLFILPVKKLGKEIRMSVPSIGVTDEITSFVIESEGKGIEVDESFIKIAPFIFEEWRGLNYKTISERMKESDSWSKEEFSLYDELSELIKIGTKLDIKLNCPTCGVEVAAPITFPFGFKSLFVISDIFGELL
jgi:hypothetical protein